jgi:HEAT repeat protein
MTTMASRWLTLIVAMAVIPTAIRADEPGSEARDKESRRLVEQLGSERFGDREEASQQLAKLGKAALPSLKEATKSPDPEVRRRAQQLVEQIEPPPAPPTRPRQEQPIPDVKSYL